MLRKYIVILFSSFIFMSCGAVATSANTEDGANSTGVADMPSGNAPSLIQQPPTINLSISDLNSIPPQDILDEVEIFGGMGGPGDPCWDENYQSPTLLTGKFNNPRRIGFVEIFVCGISSIGEGVDIQIDLPDNTIRYDRVVSMSTANPFPYSGEKYEIYFYYDFQLNDPIGNYHFVFKGNGWSLDKKITVLDITYPSFIYDTKELIFKLQPNEKVRLFVYNNFHAKLIGWKYFQVDANGQLIIHADYPNYSYAAIGDITGEVQLSARDFRSLFGIVSIIKPKELSSTAEIPICTGTQPTRLQVGMNAEITRSGMAPQLSLRVQPSLSAEKVHVIAAGRKMTILQGPVCADGSYWWYIRSEQGFEGWAREGDNEDYWIDPLP